MIEKLEKRLKKIDEISPRGISVLQWVMFAVVAAFCFLFFCHQDVLITAGHAGEYLKGHITDFYSACVDTDRCKLSAYHIYSFRNLEYTYEAFRPFAAVYG